VDIGRRRKNKGSKNEIQNRGRRKNSSIRKMDSG
jgi:hypothetical protein